MSKTQPKKLKPNLKLAKFLVQLAIDDDLRAKFNKGAAPKSKEKALDGVAKVDQLSKTDRDSLLSRDGDLIFKRLNVNQQNT
jgi:hypothetical protein